MNKNLSYRSEIDGLRAIAVLPVIVFHAGFSWMPGGYAGVDVFFVISGYLITSILVREIEAGDFSIAKFYERRIRRLLPALAFIVSVTSFFAWLWLPTGALHDYGRSVMATGAFYSNFYFWRESDYFATAAEFTPLLHTWSLAVEEQYYIFYPPLLYLVWRLKIWLLPTLAVLFCGSLSLAVWAVDWRPDAAFYLLPTRGWELLAGALAAMVLRQGYLARVGSKTEATLGVLGLCLIAYSVVAFDAQAAFPGLPALAPVGGAVLIILFSKSGSPSHALLSNRALVHIGLISYSAYLWHQPLLSLARWRFFDSLSSTALVFLCALSLALAHATWKYVEKPFRKSAPGSNRRFLLGGAGTVAALFLCGVVIQHLWEGDWYRSRAYIDNIGKSLAAVGVDDYDLDNAKLQIDSWTWLRDQTGEASYGVEDNDNDRDAWFEASVGRRGMLIVGNSHSKDIYNVFRQSRKISNSYQIARFGVQIQNIDDAFYQAPNYVAADTIVIASFYSPADVVALDSAVGRMVEDGKRVFIVHQILAFDRSYEVRFTLADKVIARNADVFETRESLRSAVNQAYFRWFRDHQSDRDYLQKRNAIAALTDKYARVSALDRMDYVCPGKETCLGLGSDGEKLFYDYGHHTLAGAAFFATVIDDENVYPELLR